MKSQIELETKVKQIFHNHGEGQAVDILLTKWSEVDGLISRNMGAIFLLSVDTRYISDEFWQSNFARFRCCISRMMTYSILLYSRTRLHVTVNQPEESTRDIPGR